MISWVNKLYYLKVFFFFFFLFFFSSLGLSVSSNGDQMGMTATIGLLHLLFEILEQNMNSNRIDDNMNSLKYVLISCIPNSRTSTFFPYLFLLSIKYPSRYSSMDTHFSELVVEGFECFFCSCCGPILKIVKNAADQSLRTL